MNKQQTHVRRKVSKAPIRKRTKKSTKRESASNAASLLSPKLLKNLSPEQFLALCSTLIEMKDGVVDIFKEVKPEKKQKMHGLIVQFLDQSDQLNLPKKYKTALGGLGQRLKQMNLDQTAPADMNQTVQALPISQSPQEAQPAPHLHHPPGLNGPHPHAGTQNSPHPHLKNGPAHAQGAHTKSGPHQHQPHHPKGPHHPYGPHHPSHPSHPYGPHHPQASFHHLFHPGRPHPGHRRPSHSNSMTAGNSK